MRNFSSSSAHNNRTAKRQGQRQSHLFTAWHCIWNREGIIYLPWLQRKIISTASQISFQPSSFPILPILFLPVRCQRKMLRSGWSGSSKGRASKEAAGSFCQAAVSPWLSRAACAIRPCLAQQEAAGCALCSCRRKTDFYPDACKMLNRNGLPTEWKLMLWVNTSVRIYCIHLGRLRKPCDVCFAGSC